MPMHEICDEVSSRYNTMKHFFTEDCAMKTLQTMSSRKVLWVYLGVIFTLLISACQPAPTPTQAPPTATLPPAATATTEPTQEIAPTPEPTVDLAPQLVDKLWLLVAFGDAANPAVVEEGTVVTALFSADGNLSGTGGLQQLLHLIRAEPATSSPSAARSQAQ